MLSGKELWDLRGPAEVDEGPSVKTKHINFDLNSKKAQKTLTDRRNALFANIECVKVGSKRAPVTITSGCPPRIIASNKTGKIGQSFGHPIDNSTKELLPEEALYLLDNGFIDILDENEVPLSLEQAYERVLFAHRVPYHQYLVFAQLTRFGGHVVKRHKTGTESSESDEKMTEGDGGSNATNYRFLYDVYSSRNHSAVAKPLYRLMVVKGSDTLPNGHVIDALVRDDPSNHGVPILAGIVDGGQVIFHSFSALSNWVVTAENYGRAENHDDPNLGGPQSMSKSGQFLWSVVQEMDEEFREKKAAASANRNG